MRWKKTATLALAVVLLASLLAAQAPLSGPEIPVSTGRREIAFSPHVATAANGDFTIVWQSRTPTSNIDPYRLWMRHFTAKGKAKTRSVLVSPPKGAETNQVDARIAMRPDGGFMVVWESGNFSPHSVAFGRCFAANGKPLGPAFQLYAGDPAPMQISPEVAAAPDGSFLVTWGSGPNPFGHDTNIFFRRFAANGKPLGPPVQVDPWSSEWQNHPHIAVSGDGDFLLTWQAGLGFDPDIVAQRFETDGRPLSSQFQVSPDSSPVPTHNEFAMALAENGESLFVWISNVPGAPPNSSGFLPTGVLGLRLTADGRQNGPLLVFQEIPGNSEEPPAAVALAGGGYFVTWKNTFIPSTIFGRHLSGDGAFQGPALQISLLGEGRFPAVAVAPNGRGVATWTADLARSSQIFARVLAF